MEEIRSHLIKEFIFSSFIIKAFGYKGLFYLIGV